MSRFGKKAVYSLPFFSAALAIACGGSDESVFVGGANGEDRTVMGPEGEIAANGGQTGPRSVTDACVSSTTNAALQKVNLVFMYDRSGSMGDLQNSPPFDPTLKWNPVGNGMKAFFSDPTSTSLNASLQFFPLGTDVASNCAAPYGTPKVALTSLSDATPFVNAIATTAPKGGTPTLPALKGAIAYAKQVAQQRPEEKPVVARDRWRARLHDRRLVPTGVRRQHDRERGSGSGRGLQRHAFDPDLRDRRRTLAEQLESDCIRGRNDERLHGCRQRPHRYEREVPTSARQDPWPSPLV